MMKTKEGRKIKAFHVIVYIILILGVSIVILPFVWMVLTSLKTQTEAVHIPVTVFPSIPHFETYAEVFKRIPFFLGCFLIHCFHQLWLLLDSV